MDTTTVEGVLGGAVDVADLAGEEFEVAEPIADEPSELDPPELSIEELEEFFRGLN